MKKQVDITVAYPRNCVFEKDTFSLKLEGEVIVKMIDLPDKQGVINLKEVRELLPLRVPSDATVIDVEISDIQVDIQRMIQDLKDLYERSKSSCIEVLSMELGVDEQTLKHMIYAARFIKRKEEIIESNKD